MDAAKRSRAKRSLIAAAMVWVAAVVWFGFVKMPENAVQTMNTPAVKDEMRDECVGPFDQRYDCKEAIVLRVQRMTFANLSFRLLLLVAGPLAAFLYFKRACRPDLQPHRHTIHDDLSWKQAAEEHILHPEPPGSERHPLSLEDILRRDDPRGRD